MKTRKLMIYILTAALTVIFAVCVNAQAETDPADVDNEVTQSAAPETPPPEESSEPTPEPTPQPTPEPEPQPTPPPAATTTKAARPQVSLDADPAPVVTTRAPVTYADITDMEETTEETSGTEETTQNTTTPAVTSDSANTTPAGTISPEDYNPMPGNSDDLTGTIIIIIVIIAAFLLAVVFPPVFRKIRRSIIYKYD